MNEPLRRDVDLASLAASMRHMTPQSLERALGGIEPWSDIPALVRYVTRFVRAHLRAGQLTGRKVLILTGEVPTLQSCLMVEMAAMQAVYLEHGSNAVLMIQHTPAAVRDFTRALAGEPAAAFDLRFGASLSSGVDKDRAVCLAAMKAHAACRLGFAVTGFDTRRYAELVSARENAMVQAVRAQLEDRDGPVIVATARRHLPVLRDALSKNHHVAALATADRSICREDQSGAELARNSYAISHARVKPFRVSNRLEHEPLRYVQFATQLETGMPRRVTLQNHISTCAP